MKPLIVGIRFQKTGKVYHFDASAVSDLQVGDFAVVETSRGRQLGEVVQIVDQAQSPAESALKPIKRKASPRDLVLRQTWQKKEEEAMLNCRERMADLGILGVKIVSAEFTFDGKRLSFLYSTEGEGKVDLDDLRKVMQRTYSHTRVEMRQIGPRDVAKLLGGMGACGLEDRCCSAFLCDFNPISIRMAKAQGVSLTPSEITGMCGRLRCCLIYEYEQYAESLKGMPKRNKRVQTPLGPGKVVDMYPLRRIVVVQLEDGQRHEFEREQVQTPEEFEALQKMKPISPVLEDEPVEEDATVTEIPAPQPEQKRRPPSRSRPSRKRRRR